MFSRETNVADDFLDFFRGLFRETAYYEGH
jgi:hypothetical protein